MRILCSFLALALLAGPAAARNIYVSNVSGDDRHSGSQAANQADDNGPVRTIAKALRSAQGGDRIVLEATGQPYRESVTLTGSRHSGFSNCPLTIEGNGAVLDGSLAIPDGHWQHYRDNIFRFRPPHMGPQQLLLEGQPPPRVQVRNEADSVPDMDPGKWCSHRGYIYFAVSANKLPSGYKLTYAELPTGFTLYQVNFVRIANLTIRGFRLDGVHVLSSGQQIVLSGATCTGNGRTGVTVGGASQVELDACLLGHNGSAQLLTARYGETHIYNSTLEGNTAPGWVDHGGLVYLGRKKVGGGMQAIQPGVEKAPQP